MIRYNTISWRDKVTPLLLRKFDEAALKRKQMFQQVVLEYRGNFSKLEFNLEILSAFEGQLQAKIDIQDLPSLASINWVSNINLPTCSRSKIS